MARGQGYFYDRKKRKYIEIDEHATDAINNYKKFRCNDVKDLCPRKDRDEIVRHVLAQGFIRVRDHRDRIGWQFHGDSISALRVLRKYIKKHEVGNRIITFTNLETNRQITDTTEAFMECTLDFIELEMGDWKLRWDNEYHKHKQKEQEEIDNASN